VYRQVSPSPRAAPHAPSGEVGHFMAPPSNDPSSAKPSKGKKQGGAKAAAARGEGVVPEDDSTCQVPGCHVLLSSLKVYNQRCRVCQEHLLAGVVDFQGSEKRFCQQCARFHAVDEFDGAKRSCRVRLERHKLQRRKRKCEAAEAVLRTGGVKQSKKASAAAAKTSQGGHRAQADAGGWGSMLRQAPPERGGRPKKGFSSQEQEDEGENVCATALANHNCLVGAQLLAGMPGERARFMDGLHRASDGGLGGGEQAFGWDDYGHGGKPGHSPRQVALPEKEDPSFMDAVLMKLHEDIEPNSEDSHLDAWPGGTPKAERLEVGYGNAEDVYGGGAFRPAGNGWDPAGNNASARGGAGSSGAAPFESVAELGYRNVQECIDGLPFNECQNLNDLWSNKASPIWGGMPGMRAPPSRNPSRGHLDLPRGPPLPSASAASKMSASSIMRMLHEEAEGGGEGLQDVGDRFGMPRGLPMGAGFPPSLSPTLAAQHGFYSRFHH